MSEMRKAFNVIQFLKPPFKNIDEYICVPGSWIHLSKPDKKIIVSYPNIEDPLIIRDLVQKKEKPNHNWRLYIAVRHYATGTYNDAINWITTHTNNDIRGRETRDAAPVNPNFLSTHQTSTAHSQAEPMLPSKGVNIFRKSLPRTSIRSNSHSDDASFLSKHSKQKQSIKILDDQLSQSTQKNTNVSLNVKTNSERTQPVKDKSITSAQSASTRFSDEKQPSRDGQNSTELLYLPVGESEGGFYVNAGDSQMQFEPIAGQTPFVPENIVVETEPNLKTQAEPYHTGFYHFIHQYPPKVDQATETDPVMDVNSCKGRVSELPDESGIRVVESSCQTEEYLLEEQPASCQGTESESDISTHDEDSDSDTSVENSYANKVSENRPITSQNPQTQQKLDEVQEMLNMFVTMFARMGANYSCTRDIFNYLQNRIIKCAEIYEVLIEKVERLNEIERLQASMTQPIVATTETSESKNSESVNESTDIGVSSETNINIPRIHTFVLPPEYDPNDSKWTLKYKQKKPGLVELIPRTNVYVSEEKLENCKRISKDCRTLARMLLTEVFSRKALSVCSLTGTKVKAFKSENLDVRPGLDSKAMMILLTFVEEYGAKCGWKICDLSAIISTIRTKIHIMRAKFDQAGKV